MTFEGIFKAFLFWMAFDFDFWNVVYGTILSKFRVRLADFSVVFVPKNFNSASAIEHFVSYSPKPCRKPPKTFKNAET